MQEITVDITDEERAAISLIASRGGQDVGEYVTALVLGRLHMNDPEAEALPTVGDIHAILVRLGGRVTTQKVTDVAIHAGFRVSMRTVRRRLERLRREGMAKSYGAHSSARWSGA